MQLTKASAIQERPITDGGVWSGWPFALASTPGAFVAVGPIAMDHGWAALAYLAVPLAIPPIRLVLTATK